VGNRFLVRNSQLLHTGFCPGLLEWWFFSNQIEQISSISITSLGRVVAFLAQWWMGRVSARNVFEGGSFLGWK
jgi:hypothetical protein